MIKYLGSKRLLVPVLGDVASAVEAKTALDLFTGTTRVAQEFKRRGIHVTATDIATYSKVFADCYITTDADSVPEPELDALLNHMNSLPPSPGYFTEVFCEESRFFQPKNGARVDAIREYLADQHADDPLLPVLLTSLILAADRVDSTTGLQMAYLKQWAKRSEADMELRKPDLIRGGGAALRGDAREIVDEVPEVDLAYLDPPYNQHRYFTNYHVWESLVRWDKPEHYGVACKRIDSRDEETKSPFNRKRLMPDTFAAVLRRVRARTVVVSYNNESWMTADQIASVLSELHEEVLTMSFDSKRYVGAQIGIHSPTGQKVGSVSHTRNLEHVLVAGSAENVRAVRDNVAPSAPVRL